MAVELTMDQRQLQALRARLKAAGDKGLNRELNKQLKAAAQPAAAAVRTAAAGLPAEGPKSTGLRQTLAANVRTRVTSSKRNPGIRISTTVPGTKRMAKNTNSTWRHPVFGNRNAWVSQSISPGWFTNAALSRRAEVRERVRLAVQNVSRQIANK